MLIRLDLLDRSKEKMRNDSIRTVRQGRQCGRITHAAQAATALLLILAAVTACQLAPNRPDAAGTPSQRALALSTTIAAATHPPTPETPAETSSPEPLTPEELDASLAQAEALTLQSHFDQAMSIYQELAFRAPDDARPETGWAWTLILDGQFEEALKRARRAMELDPLRVETVTGLARAYVKMGDRDRAIAMAQSAVQLDPASAQAHAVLAQAYQLDGQLPQAVAEADLALDLDPNSAEAHRVRGWLCLVVDGDAAQAAAELQIAAELQPQLWLWQYELGLLLSQARAYEPAIAAFQTALGLQFRAETCTALGEAYCRLGEYSQAESYLGQALAAGAGGADLLALQAALNAQQDRCDEAQTYWEQALALDPAQALALEARDTCQKTSPVRTPATTPVHTPVATPTSTPTPAQPPSTLQGQIAFPAWNAERSKYDTYVAGVDGRNRHLVAAEMHQPAFRPDGQWLALNGDRSEYMNLCLVRPDGSDLHEITEYIEDGLPTWSPVPLGGGPGGQSLAFSSTREQDRQSQVYVIDHLLIDGGKVPGRPLYAGMYQVRGEYPAWTGDGQIVYASCDYTAQPLQCGLFLISTELGAQTPEPLTGHSSDTAPAAYGAGPAQIAFMSDRDGNWEIYLVNADGSGLKRLTDNPANDGLPTWSPDGQAIAFVSDQGGVWAVWAIDPDGAHRRKLFNIGEQGLATDWQHERISWGP